MCLFCVCGGGGGLGTLEYPSIVRPLLSFAVLFPSLPFSLWRVTLCRVTGSSAKKKNKAKKKRRTPVSGKHECKHAERPREVELQRRKRRCLASFSFGVRRSHNSEFCLPTTMVVRTSTKKAVRRQGRAEGRGVAQCTAEKCHDAATKELRRKTRQGAEQESAGGGQKDLWLLDRLQGGAGSEEGEQKMRVSGEKQGNRETERASERNGDGGVRKEKAEIMKIHK